MNGLQRQRKIRFFVSELAKVLYINAMKDFKDPIVAKEAENVYKKLSSMAELDDTGQMMNELNNVESSLREIFNILYQKVFGKAAPTKLLYFSGLSVIVNQGTTQVSYECIGYRKILLLFIAIATLVAYARTQDRDFLKIFDVLHKITITSLPNDKSDIYGNAFLTKVATTLFLTAPENADQVKMQVFKWLNLVAS